MPDDRKTMDLWVATHREVDYALPEGYQVMQVNCRKTGLHWPGYLHDDEGVNISEKNDCYCELTVLYSLWKNSDADIKGLCHYRRYFTDDPNAGIGMWKTKAFPKTEVRAAALRREEILSALREHDMILPIPNGPFPGMVKDERLEYCYQKDLDILKETIELCFPAYKESYEWVMNQRFLSTCNMFIAGKEVFDSYCAWLFDVLGAVEQRCDIDAYDTQHKRLYGFLSEILLNVYAVHNKLSCAFYNKLLVSDYWENKGLKGAIKKTHAIRTLRKMPSGKLLVGLYKVFGRRSYRDYALLRTYIADFGVR